MTPKQEAAMRQALEAFNHVLPMVPGSREIKLNAMLALQKAIKEAEKEKQKYNQAKHQEELNKFAEDSVWDGEGEGQP